MKHEIDAVERNKTWELVPFSKSQKLVDSRWVFTNKWTPEGKKIFKSRLVARGFSQRQGIDYSLTYSPVSGLDNIRLFLAVACQLKHEIMQLDVGNAFLNGDLKEEILLRLPLGIAERNKYVCKLNKSLYGLKQSPSQALLL